MSVHEKVCFSHRRKNTSSCLCVTYCRSILRGTERAFSVSDVTTNFRKTRQVEELITYRMFHLTAEAERGVARFPRDEKVLVFTRVWAFVFGVCACSRHARVGFSSGVPVSSHSPKTCT